MKHLTLLNLVVVVLIGAGALMVTALEGINPAMPLWTALIAYLVSVKVNGSATSSVPE